MSWTNLIWVLLYFAVGWIVTGVYQMDDDILKLLVFLGWPVLVVGFLTIFVLLFLFGLVFVVEEISYELFRRKRTGKGQEK